MNQMNTMDRIPYEILEEIFLYLESEDLWHCLGVSRAWRNVANADKLWKKHCSEIGIDEIPTSAVPGSEELCEWASAYYVSYLLPLKNWKLGRYRLFHVPVEDSHFIELWEGDRGAVYYYKIDRLTIHEVYSHGIRSSTLNFLFKDLPREVFTLSIGLNKSYLAVSNYNIVIIYKSISGTFISHKILSSFADNLKISNYNDDLLKESFSFDSTLQVKAISSDFLWLSDNYGDKLFVVDLVNDTIRWIQVRSYFTYSIYSPFIATWDEDINIYDKKGNIVFTSDINCWDLCFNSKILVIGNKNTQKVETWNIKLGEKLVSKSVLYHTDMVIHPKKNILILAEKGKEIYRFTCIDAIKGNIIWRISPPPHQNRCHQLKVVSDYVFIWHSYLSRPKYSLLDLTNGKLINEGLLPQNRTHVSNTLWVFLEYDHFKVMSYLGCNSLSNNTITSNTH